ncbi:hypothetical protein JTF06_00270 [Desemzia sp. RIT804]|uniref:hypothetical protein n=1 Tax=Desemzia sp. RIT 804 TaxID=2810209 RepID=UPI001950C2CA|nr:hypothetical protein [Desemzia sp. RIT 804]MBM6613321.1 hypothetical protein [Desemzia sp. RIT 804]
MSEQVLDEAVDKYEMIFEGSNEKRTLTVCPEDLIENADGQLDCPLDYVLRRNQLAISDLNAFSPERAIFVHKKGETSTILNEIVLNVNF